MKKMILLVTIMMVLALVGCSKNTKETVVLEGTIVDYEHVTYCNYSVVVSLGDELQIVRRNNLPEINDKIYVEKIMTYNESKELINTEYR